MIFLKKCSKPFLYTSLIIIIGLFIVTILSYFNILGAKVVTVIKLALPIIGLFTGSFNLGKNSNQKGWLEGGKYGFLVCLLLFIINLILQSFKSKTLIFYLILIITSGVGGMIGISNNKDLFD